MSTELTRIAPLFNSKIYKEISPLLDDFPWESELAKSVGDIVKDGNEDISDETIISLLTGKLIPSEIDILIDNVHKFREISKPEDIKLIVNSIFEYYQTRKLQKALDIYAVNQNLDKLLSDVKNIPEELASDLEIKTLGNLNPREVYEREIGGQDNVLPTTLEVIKNATPFKGYLPGQVIQVVAPPGVGKSAFILQEVSAIAANGYKVLMLVLGDLMEFDLITRFTALITGTKYYEVAVNPDKYFTEEISSLAQNIDFVITPSKALSSQMIVDMVKFSKTRYDVVVVDYDSNVKTSSDNMYDAGGELYDRLTEIARPKDQPYRLVFVACQPKIQYWEQEELPEDSAGESSRKQHNVDMMITIGKAVTSSGKRCGIISLPKVRRGTPGLKTPYIVRDWGEFEEIQMNVYKTTKSYSS